MVLSPYRSRIRPFFQRELLNLLILYVKQLGVKANLRQWQILSIISFRRQWTNLIRLRSALPEDCALLWHWRNDARTRPFFFNSQRVSIEDHRSWFQKRLADPRCRIYIAMAGRQP